MHSASSSRFLLFSSSPLLLFSFSEKSSEDEKTRTRRRVDTRHPTDAPNLLEETTAFLRAVHKRATIAAPLMRGTQIHPLPCPRRKRPDWYVFDVRPRKEDPLTAFSLLVLVAAALPSLSDSPAVELQYTGTLTATGRQASKTPVKRFTLHCLFVPEKSGGQLAFFVEEQGGGGWPWPERFGRIPLDRRYSPSGNSRIRVLHTHQGTKNPLTVQQPIFEFASRLTDTAAWKNGNRRYEVVRRRKIGKYDCRQVEVSGRIGWSRTVWVAVNSPIVVKSRQTVFMGRGDRFLLEIKLKSASKMSAVRLAKLRKPLGTLLILQQTLKRKHLETRPELSQGQLAAVKTAMRTLDKDARNTPYHSLVAFVKGDAESQQKRAGEISTLAKKFVGRKAPKFSLKTLAGKAIDPKEFAGKITVLHFWEYQGPLEAPYGQVGYLDYLNSKRAKLGVKVYGVAVDSRLSVKSRSSLALRAIRKLKNDMNLSYPVTQDDGTLLKKFGDPRTASAKLPLWVVIDSKGIVRQYKTGFYKIRPDEGLRPLDVLLIRLIRESRRN